MDIYSLMHDIAAVYLYSCNGLDVDRVRWVKKMAAAGPAPQVQDSTKGTKKIRGSNWFLSEQVAGQ